MEQSMVIDQEISESGDGQKEKAKNVIFELPKYLICIKRKNVKYESYIFKKNVENYKVFFNFSCTLLILFLGLSEVTIFGEGKDSNINTERTIYLISLGIMGVMALLMLYLSTQLTRRSPRITILTIFIFYIICFGYAAFVEIAIRETNKSNIDFFFIVIFMTAFVSHLRVLMFRMMVMFYILNIIGWVILKIFYPSEAVKHTFFLICVIITTMINHYSNEKAFRISFNYERSLNHEIKRTQALLRNLVPPNVFRGLLKGKRIADNLQNVTLLYTDMCGFTNFSKTREPSEVVKLLSELFQRMDNLCIKNNVYKVHTIGDCYVVSGYTGKVSNEKRDVYQEAINVIETGFDMLDIIKTVREEMGIADLDMRIGIHTGMMTAGIIGSNIVRYDIFGSDVLIANKMESSGANGKVCASEETRKMVLEHQPDKYKFSKHVTVNINSLGMKIKEYIVTRSDNSSFVSESSSEEGDSIE